MLILVLILLLIFGGGGYYGWPGGAPGWYGPGFGGVFLIIILILLFTGRL